MYTRQSHLWQKISISRELSFFFYLFITMYLWSQTYDLVRKENLLNREFSWDLDQFWQFGNSKAFLSFIHVRESLSLVKPGQQNIKLAVCLAWHNQRFFTPRLDPFLKGKVKSLFSLQLPLPFKRKQNEVTTQSTHLNSQYTSCQSGLARNPLFFA